MLDKEGKLADEVRPVAFLARVRAKLAESAASFDAFAIRLAHAVTTLALWPVLYAAAIGAGVFVFRHLTWVAQLDTNKVAKADTYKLAIAVGVAAGGLASPSWSRASSRGGAGARRRAPAPSRRSSTGVSASCSSCRCSPR
jgi:predicted MFS family arabinose efflux permease